MKAGNNISSEAMLLCLTATLLLASCLVAPVDASSLAPRGRALQTDGGGGEVEEESEPRYAVLFPIFTLIIGSITYYVTTRFAAWLPFTAVMFFWGTMMGIAALHVQSGNQLYESITAWWINIDSEVLLLVFLPGLIFKDSISLNTHLFFVAIWQCMNMAFPMVLAGTALTALVLYYLFPPFQSSLDLCLTLGSILSATDPVAVSALLEQVGAPPRLQIHIGGESLLNDGSAIVFYTIFSARYFYEFGVDGFGADIGWGEGFLLFFRMSLGGACIGFAFAVATIGFLRLFTRTLDRTENLVEVATTLTVAYLCYYVADAVCGTSGVIANLTLGLTIRAWGATTVNDMDLFEDFWGMIEWMIDTVLFTLGGLQWGSVIANRDPDNSELVFTGTDWGYLFVLYIFLTLIRYFLFTVFFPCNAKMGLKSNWKEMIFQSYGGLRGAVGIALAIALDNSVRSTVGAFSPYALQSTKAFGFIGGITFLTLMINASTAGPILKALGLVTPTKIRECFISCVRSQLRAHTIKDMVRLLAQQRFVSVSFAVIKTHVPLLADLTRSEFLDAVQRYHDGHHSGNPDDNSYSDYAPPNIQFILPYLTDDKAGHDAKDTTETTKSTEASGSALLRGQFSHDSEEQVQLDKAHMAASVPRLSMVADEDTLTSIELRLVFLEMLRSAYQGQVDHGDMGGNAILSYSMLQSVDFAIDQVNKGEPLRDWDYTTIAVAPRQLKIVSTVTHWQVWDWIPEFFRGRSTVEHSAKFLHMQFHVERCVSFMHAHHVAQDYMKTIIGAHRAFSAAETAVIKESQAEVVEAIDFLKQYDQGQVQLVVSHMFCNVLLNNAAAAVKTRVNSGVLKEQEGEQMTEEVQESIQDLMSCSMENHPGELSLGSEEFAVYLDNAKAGNRGEGKKVEEP